MGNIRKIRKKYKTPKKLWDKRIILVEKELMKKYGFKNKKEIWKINTILNNFKEIAKKIIRSHSDSVDIERAQLMNKLISLGLLNENSTLDDVLSLTNEDIMQRRLQTIVFKKGLAISPKQARQMIVHRHILVNGKKITSPSYLVTVEEESAISFSPYSRFFNDEHPERQVILQKLKGEVQKTKKESPQDLPSGAMDGPVALEQDKVAEALTENQSISTTEKSAQAESKPQKAETAQDNSETLQTKTEVNS